MASDPHFRGLQTEKTPQKISPGRLAAAGPYGRIAPEGGGTNSPTGLRRERVRERRERIEIIFFYGELGNLEEPN